MKQPSLVAKRIRHVMDLRGITSTIELERQTGASRETTRRLLAGLIQNPRLDTLQKIAAYLNTTLGYLTGETDQIEATKDAILYIEDKPADEVQNINIPSWISSNEAALTLTSNRLSPAAVKGDMLLLAKSDYSETGQIYCFIYKDQVLAGFVSKNLDGIFVVKDGSGSEIGKISPDEISFIGSATKIIKSL